MQLIIGGAFSGKRKIVRKMGKKIAWLSAYDGDLLSDWNTRWTQDSVFVLEGFEKWVGDELARYKNHDQVRSEMKKLFHLIKLEERERKSEALLIMVELGRGIVPIEKNERVLRDLVGWITQDAADLSDQVHYVWNGLSKKLK
ncbi:bifunctional adenosylcobinamide kinase/adenosylcobinamide-phosphate guanylyltransferase [Halalkalibacter okhensis]|uniref:Adenosylcobinamide kinase n=1 Tax=Halalkalibacter okhensis TaxID=333138 RepID=A0A0B0IHI1_9BACI|nr:bifunctional adenosylcobinamide kinase/adenosylcobinamide-phosphate guanylyltransferase [Halalkalibacter okhensis]KHF40750.1 hypothetical protein LQ50_08185 [Halalkalibacter okhensis]